MAYNKVIMQGNLSKDIELRYTSGGMALANTSIAVSHKFTSNGEKKEETCFVEITFFGKSAEIANQYLRKGSKCLIDGRLKLDQWTDKDGGKRSKHSIVVESFQMLDSKTDTQSNDTQSYNEPSGMTPSFGQNQQGYGVNQGQQAPQQQSPNYGQTQQDKAPKQQQMYSYDINEEDIPF